MDDKNSFLKNRSQKTIDNKTQEHNLTLKGHISGSKEHTFTQFSYSYRPRSAARGKNLTKTEADKRPMPKIIFDELNLLERNLPSWDNVVDHEATGKRLRDLRENNAEFGRTFCRLANCLDIRLAINGNASIDKTNYCEHGFDCSNCNSYRTRIKGGSRTNIVTPSYLEMGDTSNLSHLGEKGVTNAENGNFSLETLLLYSFYSKVPITKIIVLKNGYHFDKDGRLIWEEYENLMQGKTNDDYDK